MTDRAKIYKFFNGVKPYTEAELNGTSECLPEIREAARRVNERWLAANLAQREAVQKLKALAVISK